MEKGPRGTGTWSRKYLELMAAAEESGDGGEGTENLSILKEEEETKASLWSSSLMVSKTLGLLRLMTETNWGGQASLINLANREVAAIFMKFRVSNVEWRGLRRRRYDICFCGRGFLVVEMKARRWHFIERAHGYGASTSSFSTVRID